MKKYFIVAITLILLLSFYVLSVYADDNESKSNDKDQDIVNETENNKNNDDSTPENNNEEDKDDSYTPKDSNKPTKDSKDNVDNTSKDGDDSKDSHKDQNSKDSNKTVEKEKPSEDKDDKAQQKGNVIVDDIEKKIPYVDTLTRKNAWLGKTVYLTFDDGPSWVTEKILDLLKKEDVKATFFVIGNDDDYGKSLLKRMDKEGHAIGNHTYSHDYSYIYKNLDNFFQDFYKNEAFIYEAIGRKTNLVRLPGGSNNNVSRNINGRKVMLDICNSLEKKGYVYFDWNASSGDASVVPATTDQIVNTTLQWIGRHQNPIVLFHDSAAKANTLKALPIIIEKLKFLGCDFEVLSENSPRVVFLKTDWKDGDVRQVLSSTRQPKPKHVIAKLERLYQSLEYELK